MSTPVLTFFNNKGGVGKTSLIYHLSWMFAYLRKRVVIIDLDPQANLTAAFLDEDQIEKIWEQKNTGSTIYQCIKPLMDVGDIAEPVLQPVATDLHLLPGDVNLSGFEDTLSAAWPDSMDKEEKKSFPNFKLPDGKMQPIGYLCQQYGVRQDRPVKAYDKWVQRIPAVYRESILHESASKSVVQQEKAPYCLATIKHYRSLIPMGQG